MLFVYGTLQDADILSAVLGRPTDTTSLRPATAPGFRAVAYPGRVYPALTAAATDSAPGLLLDALSETDIALLDAFEGEEYRRQTIAVKAGGALYEADAYLPVAVISSAAPAWSLPDWTAMHKPAVLGQERATAMALRQRLSSQAPS
jgi:gamma-glutamylcyclotransferase (GGCT)/AIG2-like uncharacterized protein YtfP